MARQFNEATRGGAGDGATAGHSDGVRRRGEQRCVASAGGCQGEGFWAIPGAREWVWSGARRVGCPVEVPPQTTSSRAKATSRCATTSSCPSPTYPTPPEPLLAGKSRALPPLFLTRPGTPAEKKTEIQGSKCKNDRNYRTQKLRTLKMPRKS